MWPSTQADASAWLKRVWLEFDETRGEVSTPSIFLSLREQVQPEALVRHAEYLFNGMADVTLDPVARQYLLRACRPGLDFSQISDLGCMASRECQTMRLILPCRSSRGVLACLEAFEWSGDLSATQEWCSRLFRVVKELRICIDVSDRILPTVGLEIAINADSRDDPAALALGEMFVQRNFCRPRELAALLQWPGIITPQDAQGSWPQDLVVESIEGQANALTALQCRFSHFKVTLGVNVEPVVKAYFGYFETWLGTSNVHEQSKYRLFARG